MEFRQSQIGDLDQIVRIAEDAKAFLRASGVSQWQRGTYPDRALFASDVASGIGWVLADGDRICAVCAVTFDMTAVVGVKEKSFVTFAGLVRIRGVGRSKK